MLLLPATPPPPGADLFYLSSDRAPPPRPEGQIGKRVPPKRIERPENLLFNTENCLLIPQLVQKLLTHNVSTALCFLLNKKKNECGECGFR
jgi:hypothetical protein